MFLSPWEWIIVLAIAVAGAIFVFPVSPSVEGHNQRLKHWCDEANGYYTTTITGYGECELPGRSE
jgi:hypothetical protein